MSFNVDTREMKRLERELEAFGDKVAKAASSQALTDLARGAKVGAQRAVRRTMTTRNKWTIGSIQSTGTPRGRPIASQFTLAGSKQEYMRDQELGGRLSKTKRGRRLTTPQGSGEGDTAWPRKKLARGALRTQKIKLPRRKRVRGLPEGVTAHIQVEVARKKGFRFAYLVLGRDKEGIFDVKRKGIKMVHRVMRRRLRVKPRPWLKPASLKMKALAPELWARAMRREIAAAGIFR